MHSRRRIDGLVLVLLAVGVFATGGCARGGGADRQDEAGTVAATHPSATTAGADTEAVDPTEPIDMADAGATAIEVEGDWLAAGGQSVWLTDPPVSEIRRLDPQSGGTLATIAVPQGPCAASDFAFGALWTATCDKPGLARIEPGTNSVAGHVSLPGAGPSGGEASIGAGEGGVWLVTAGRNCESCIVARVDPKSLRVVARVGVDDGAAAVRVGEGAVWVTNPQRSVVQKIDPRQNRVVATTAVGPGPRFLAVGEGAVWTLNQGDGSVTRLDPRTGNVAATIRADVVGEGGDITTGGGSVWARGRGYLLTRIDPETDGVAERYGPSVGSGAVVVAFGAVWVSAHDVSTLWRLPVPPGE